MTDLASLHNNLFNAVKQTLEAYTQDSFGDPIQINLYSRVVPSETSLPYAVMFAKEIMANSIYNTTRQNVWEVMYELCIFLPPDYEGDSIMMHIADHVTQSLVKEDYVHSMTLAFSEQEISITIKTMTHI